MKPMLQTVPRMAKQLLKNRFSGEEVLAFLEDDLEEENEGGMEDTFFPGSDEELGCEDVDSEETHPSVQEIRPSVQGTRPSTQGTSCFSADLQ